MLLGRKRYVCLNLRSVEVDIPNTNQSSFGANREYFAKDCLHEFFMAGPETRYGTVAGDRIAGQSTIRQFLLGSFGYLARGAPPLPVGIDQNGEHHHRIVRGPVLGSVRIVERGELHLLDDIVDKSNHVIFGDPLVY